MGERRDISTRLCTVLSDRSWKRGINTRRPTFCIDHVPARCGWSAERRLCNILLRRCRRSRRRRVRARDISSSAVFAVFLPGGSDLLIGTQSAVRRGD